MTKLRSVAYRCTICKAQWFRVVNRRVVLPTPCPFCGGRGKITREDKMTEMDSWTSGRQMRNPTEEVNADTRLDAVRKLERFARLQAHIQAEIFSLTLSTGFVAQAEYSDESLDAMIVDARDMRRAADALASFIEELAESWRESAHAA